MPLSDAWCSIKSIASSRSVEVSRVAAELRPNFPVYGLSPRLAARRSLISIDVSPSDPNQVTHVDLRYEYTEAIAMVTVISVPRLRGARITARAVHGPTGAADVAFAAQLGFLELARSREDTVEFNWASSIERATLLSEDLSNLAWLPSLVSIIGFGSMQAHSMYEEDSWVFVLDLPRGAVGAYGFGVPLGDVVLEKVEDEAFMWPPTFEACSRPAWSP
jgi:hypothetical protein